MSEPNSTESHAHIKPDKPENKPAKPSPDFPLFPHATRRWAKKIKGKMHYFGPWSDPEGARQRYLAFIEAKKAGVGPSGDQTHQTHTFYENATQDVGNSELTECESENKTHTTLTPTGDVAATVTASGRPAKPSPDFPLFPHSTGRWAKKIRGKFVYFGSWNDPQGALDRYNANKERLRRGEKPRPDPGTITVNYLASHFLLAKQDRVNSGELSPRTYAQYEETCRDIVATFGKHRPVADLFPDDFATLRKRMAERYSPGTLGNFIIRVRVVFKYAAKEKLIPNPVDYGGGFTRPSKKALRKQRQQGGRKLFTAEEIRRLIGLSPWAPAAPPQLVAMILLGINAGLGNADCGRLPKSALDMDNGWLEFPRVKTGIERRIPLWPETVAAIREAIAQRPEPKDPADAELVFITRFGQAWHTDTTESPISYEMGKLLRRLHINGRRRLGFYSLRHTFRTIGDETKDQPACDAIMGHAPESDDMRDVYREGIKDERLKAVTDYVRRWLFGHVQ